MSTSPMTTVDRLRQAIADTLSIDAQGLQAAIGQLVVATSADYPAAGPEARSLHSSAVRTTVLLADRIPAGQEAQALAAEISRWHGRQAAQAVIGERAAELLGGDGKVESAIDLDDVGEWVGLHYGRNFDAEPDAKRQEWIERYAEAHDLPVPQGSVRDEAQNPKSTVVEYVSVWDEGTVTTHAVLDLRTGAVTDIEASDDGQDYEHLQYEEIRDVSRGVSAIVVPNDKGQYFLEDLSMLTQFGGADIANEGRKLPDAKRQPVMQKFRVLGAHHDTRNFFEVEVDAADGQFAFGAAARMLEEAGAHEDAEFYAAIPAGVAYVMPGDSVVTLGTVLDPEQQDVFGVPEEPLGRVCGNPLPEPDSDIGKVCERAASVDIAFGC